MKMFVKIPLLLIIFLVFNLIIFSNPNALHPKAMPIFSPAMPSGAVWDISIGNFLVMGGVLLLFLEFLKSIRFKKGAIIEQLFSLAIFVAFLVEFVIWRPACNSTCVILMLICLLDVIGGFVFTAPKTRRDFNIDGIH